MVKPFYIDTKGARVFALNQSYGAGSQLQAGARAEFSEDPLTKALTTFGGRIASRTMQYMYRGDITKLRNYARFRPIAMQHVINSVLDKTQSNQVVIDPASGYSPVFYKLAQQNLTTTFIEVDTEKVITNKKRLLADFEIPENLQFRTIDLSEKYLHDAVPQKADVLIGLGAYVNHSDYRDMLDYAQYILNENGIIIATFPYRKGIDNFLENSVVFSKIVTHPIGVVDSVRAVQTIFHDTGYTIESAYKLSDLAKILDYPTPTDAEIIVVARLKSLI